MKHISKFFAAALAALTIISCSSAVAGAAEVKPCSPQIRVICKSGNCSGLDKLLEKYCGTKNCNLNEILKKIGGFCPDGNCTDTNPFQAPVTPAKPVVTPQKPVVTPAKPVVTPAQPAAPAQTDSAEFNTAYEAEVLRLVNIERAKYGLSPLVQDNGATQTAHLRAKEIVKSFSHTRPDGSSCFTAAKEFGVTYRSAGENIAYGYPTPNAVVTGWMNSEGHRKNILSGSFSKIGIGCYKSGGVLYWSQFFIG